MAAIQLEQLANIAGVAVQVTINSTVGSSVHCVFTDAIHNSSTDIDSTIISTKQIQNTAVDASGKKVFTVYLSQAAYDALPDGNKKVNFKATTGTGAGKKSAVLGPLTYLQTIPFTVESIIDGVEKAHVTLQLDNERYLANSAEYAVFATVYQDGLIKVDEQGVEIDYGIIYSDPSSTGEVEITIGGTGNNRLPVGTYEIAVTVSNSIGSVTRSATVIVSTDPANVEATSFNTFDVSGAMFQLEYGPKDYSGYSSDLTLYGIITQTGNNSTDLGVTLTIADICGVTFNESAPSEFIMDASSLAALTPIDVDGGYDGEKFKIELWLEGQDASGTLYQGPKTTSSFWLDQKLATPTVALDAINWDTGAQTTSITADGSFNSYEVVCDLSGSVHSVIMDVSGNEKAYASHTYSYNTLLPVSNGDYKELSVHVQRPEINHLDASNPPLNKSDIATLDYLKAIKRAGQPLVYFTDITQTSDGSVEFAYIEASANTDLYAELGSSSVSDEFNLIDSSFGEIPDADASNVIFNFIATLVGGTKYIMNAYSRFDMAAAGYDSVYSTLNNNSNLLLSRPSTIAQFFTDPPTMTMTVIPTGDTNSLSTVRMVGEANGNNISRLLMYAKDVSGQVLESSTVIGPNFVDTCGNVILNLGSNVNNFNTSFIQDFVFTETISIDQTGGMFLLGIVDTPNQVDAILVEQTVNALTTDHNNAINAYNTGVVAHNIAVDACNNPLSDADYAVADALYTAWTASGEALEQLLIDTCGTVLAGTNTVGSDNNVTDLSGISVNEALLHSAMGQTADSISSNIISWTTNYDSATPSEKSNLRITPITYEEYEVSGNTFTTTITEIPIPPILTSGGYSTTYLLQYFSDYMVTVTNQANISQTATAAYNAAVIENNILKGIIDTINGTGAGSLSYAVTQAVAAETNRTARMTVLQGGAVSTKTALVGTGTVQAPSDGSLVKAMNDTRAALSNAVGGVELFVVPALAL